MVRIQLTVLICQDTYLCMGNLFYFIFTWSFVHFTLINPIFSLEEKKTTRHTRFPQKPFTTVKYFGKIQVDFISLFWADFFSLSLVLCTFHTMSRIFLNKPKSVQRVIQIVSMESLRRKKLWHEQIPNTATYVFLSINLEQCVQLTYWFGIFRDALSRCMRYEQKDEKQSVRNPH